MGRSASLGFVATIEAGHAAAFAEAVGGPAGRIPATYPVVWLSRPEVIGLVRGLAADRPDALPVHEWQSVESFAPLPTGRPLAVEVTAERADATHIRLEMRVAGKDGEPLARLAGSLRLVP